MKHLKLSILILIHKSWSIILQFPHRQHSLGLCTVLDSAQCTHPEGMAPCKLLTPDGGGGGA